MVMEKYSIQSEARVPFPQVFLTMVVLWATYFTIITVRAYLGDFEFQEEMLARRAAVVVAGIVMTLVLWSILRLFDSKPFWMRVAAALIVAMPASAERREKRL